MNKKAQAGLEYLVTYGWALVIIATVIGVLVFIVSMPPDIVFASSRPDKLMIKGGSINAGSVEISVQNITGGQIRIVSVELDDQGFIQSIGGSKLNGTLIGPEMTPVEVKPGGGLLFEGIEYQGPGNGYVTIGYKDRFNLEQTTIVSIKGTVNVPAPEVEEPPIPPSWSGYSEWGCSLAGSSMVGSYHFDFTTDCGGDCSGKSISFTGANRPDGEYVIGGAYVDQYIGNYIAIYSDFGLGECNGFPFPTSGWSFTIT